MNNNVLTSSLFELLAKTAGEECLRIGVGVTLAIVDDHGHLMYLQRFADAILPSIEIAQNKAYTAAVTRMTTAEFGQIAQPGESAFGINITAPRLVIFGGGFPLIRGERIAGGMGVSGGSVAEDEQIAHAVLDAFEKYEA